MNTPAHLIVNAVALGRGRWRPHWFPITAGALLPDLPMVGFYLYQKLLLGAPERTIWSQVYFEPRWQILFDLFNSFPLIALAALIAWRLRATAWLAFFASMALHCLADLPLHNEDAHAHFFPFSDWHFRSPISYWDPAHHGSLFLGVELLVVIAGAIVLMRRSRPKAWRYVGVLTLVLYMAFGMLAFSIWGGL